MKKLKTETIKFEDEGKEYSYQVEHNMPNKGIKMEVSPAIKFALTNPQTKTHIEAYSSIVKTLEAFNEYIDTHEIECIVRHRNRILLPNRSEVKVVLGKQRGLKVDYVLDIF